MQGWALIGKVISVIVVLAGGAFFLAFTVCGVVVGIDTLFSKQTWMLGLVGFALAALGVFALVSLFNRLRSILRDP